MLVSVVLFTLIQIAYSEGDVVELDQSNFEHLTQLNSGATTGDWFIKFYAPWCGHCKRLAPTWEEVATELKGEVNVAKVDVTQNRALGKQFGVKGFPTLLLFRRGKMVKYSGARDKDSLVAWAKTADGSDAIPGPAGAVDQALGGVVKVLEDLVAVLNKFPVPCIMLILGGMFIGILLGAIMCGGGSSQPQYEQQGRPNGTPAETTKDPANKKNE